MFSSIKFSNFKNFQNIDLKLHQENIIIGPNSSGKSNFVGIFSFIKDISQFGLEDAISRQGSQKYLPNLKMKDEPIEIKFSIKYPGKKGDNFGIWWTVDEIHYHMKFRFINKKIIVEKDEFAITGVSSSRDELYDGIHYISRIWYGDKKYNSETVCSRDIIEFGRPLSEQDFKKLADGEYKPLDPDKDFKQLYPSSHVLTPDKLEDRYILLEIGSFPYIVKFKELLLKIGIYDFDTKSARLPSQISSKKRLTVSGDNLSRSLSDILWDKEQKIRFVYLLRNVFPHIDTLKPKEIRNQITFEIKEKFLEEGIDIPSELISDGTTNIIAIIVSLYFQDNSVTILEEPEKYIHPHLMRKILEMVDEVKSDNQIIITTHNPEMLKNSSLEDILVINRNSDGQSEIRRVEDIAGLNDFLSDQIVLDHLFTKNLLQWV